jgi:hypothetical protein
MRDDAVRQWLAVRHPDVLAAYDAAPANVQATIREVTVLEARALALGDVPGARADDEVHAALTALYATVARADRTRR